jgi:hypothetical protein
MELLRDVGEMEAHFGPFDARLVHALHRTYRRLRNHFGRT